MRGENRLPLVVAFFLIAGEVYRQQHAVRSTPVTILKVFNPFRIY